MCEEIRNNMITNTELEEVTGGVEDSDTISNNVVTTGYKDIMDPAYIKGVPGGNQPIAGKPGYPQ